MEQNRSNSERPCPDCGTTLERREDGAFLCSQENVVWMAYGPKLLLREAVIKSSHLALELPWETQKAA